MTLLSCRKDEQTEIFEFRKPELFPEPVYGFENNPLSYDKFILGRTLFHDPILSSDSTISCASCHSQTHFFSDHNVAFSLGVNDSLGKRNSPAIANAAWFPYFMWDGGVNHIEVFSTAPIMNPLEMNETFTNIVNKLNNSSNYQDLFQKAFDDKVVTDQKILFALAQYMAMIISDNSKYDQYMRGELALSQQEMDGLNLFREKCASCHKEPLFTDFSFRDNGLDLIYSDLGRATITQQASDEGKFKVPSLRNVEMTYPYMHDGRFFTLEMVLNHYSENLVNSPNLDPSLSGGIPLSDTEKSAIIAFLKTLTDYSLIENELLMDNHVH